ncbi:glutathione S-transferase [Phenylobacterium sp. LjRoot219]|uniref:glutathione S-transferase family protein n=1 Tax=Phenylobacterium sp. LjRoot219 TaxID=3342283 RepID=UPI003ECFB9F8
MITVHHLSTSHSHVILWLLEELGLPYEMVAHQREASARAPDSLRAVHPAGKSPTIEDHGLAMIESTGIILYILDAYGQGRLRPPANTPEAMQFFQWLTYVEGSAKAQLVALLRLLRLSPEDPSRPMLEAAAAIPMQLIDAALEGQETIVPGQFTAADLQLAFYEEIIDARGMIAEFPNMRAHLERMRARPAYQRALAKGGPVIMGTLANPEAGR